MTNRQECPKAARKAGSPCIFCGDGSYCAHQYFCPATHRYENTGFQKCRRFSPPAPEKIKTKKKEDQNGTQDVNKRRPGKG